MILADTSALLANYDSHDRHHDAVERVLAEPQRRILSSFVLAEPDYLIHSMAGKAVELAVLEDVARGAYDLVAFDGPDVAAARAVIERYAALQLGLADASLVVLAARYSCDAILTLDERHFRAIHGPADQPFRLLPADV